jgi:TRAP transporter TAXI family solute receptor
MKRFAGYRAFVLLAAVLLMVALTAFAQAAPAPAVDRTGWPKEVVLIGSSPTGTYTVFVTLVAEVIRKYMGITATGIPGGTGPGVPKLLRKEAEGIIMAHQSAYDSARKLGVFKVKANVAGLFAGQGMAFNIVVRADSGLNSVADFRGKRFIASSAGSTPVGQASDQILKRYGMTRNDVKFITITTPAEAVEMMQAKEADAWQMSGGLPYAPMLELASSLKLKFIGLTQEDVNKIVADNPGSYMPYVIPARTYPNQDKDVFGLGTGSILAMRKELPDSFVYMVMKTVFDHLDELHAGPSFMKEVTLKNATEAPVIPFHPGAIRFYKEKGVWTAEMEKLQTELIKETGN